MMLISTGARLGGSFALSTVRSFLLDDSGQALFEYAVVTAVFAAIMIALYLGVQTNASQNLNGTQSGLSAEAGDP